MLDWLYTLLGSMLSWFESFTGSYAIALLLYALLFKIVFLPFSYKQQKNQIKLAKLTPKIELIKAKYRGSNDQATLRKQQEEIMALQQQEGYSPLSGCLPLLLQMPIIILLYKVIRNPLSYILKLSDEVVIKLHGVVNNLDASQLESVKIKSIDQIALAGQIQNYYNSSALGKAEIMNAGLESLDVLPNFNLWGLNLAEKPSFVNFSWLILIPVLAAGFQWLTMYISRKFSGNASQATMDEQAQMSMKMMDLMMPAMTLWFTFSFSAMMGLYWIYQSIFSIIQILILSKIMPVPKYTEEELKSIQKAKKVQQKAQTAIIKTQPKYKSLHYIDEDDYDELPEVKTQSKKHDTKTTLNSDKPEIKD